MEAPEDDNLLVGYATSDDAAVYRVSDDLAVISTADFITPPVDDPYWFGQIAAANALSDVYAMGGRPLTALNLVMFPTAKLDIGILKDILKGGHDKVREAGAVLAGGHSVEDNEPKYGLAVTGVVHPGRILTNRGARAGDALVLTKPLGTGVLLNAHRSGRLPYRELEPLLPEIANLNRSAIETALPYDIHACTDITGFGLVGHLLEMVADGGIQFEISFASLPFHPNALQMYDRGETTGSNRGNRMLAADRWRMDGSRTAAEEELLFDPQTSGGLALALPESQADDLVASLKQAGVGAACRIGQVSSSERPLIRVV